MPSILEQVTSGLDRELRSRDLQRRDLTECLEPWSYPIVGESEPGEPEVVAYLSRERLGLVEYLDKVQRTVVRHA